MKCLNKIIGLIILCSLLSTCGDSTEVKVSEYNDPRVETLIEEATDIDYLIASEQILRNSSQRDKDNLKSSLHNIRVNLAILDENPNDANALQRLNSALDSYQGLIITERDQERIRPIFDLAAKLLAKYAKAQNTDLENIRWSVFSYRFSDGLGDFTNMIENSTWKVRYVQQERYLANFGNGSPSTAVMLSPIYDLSNVKNAAYSIRHNIGVEDDLGSEATRAEIMNNTFKVMVSTTYQKGEEFDFSKFKRLPMGPIPTGLNFDTVDSGIIDLSAYSGKKNVTFAIVFDQQKRLERFSWISWSIERFNLYGLTDTELPYVSAYIPPIPSSWSYQFGEQGFSNLQQVTVEGTPDEFVVGEHGGNKFIKMQNQNARGTKLLFTAPLDLKSLNEPAVQFEHTINFYEGEAKEKKDLRMMVAEYQEGVHPKDLAWETLDFEVGPDGGSWNVFKSEDLPLPDKFKGKVVRLGWSHTSRDGSTPVWQMISTNIKDLTDSGFNVEVLEDDFSTGSDADDTPVDPAAFTWNYDFGGQGLSDFSQITLEGAPGQFTEGEHNGVAFVKMQARDVVGTQLLFSNVIDLTSNKEATIQVSHTINFYKDEFKAQNDVKILVALDQESVEAKDLTWEVLDFQQGPNGSDWNVYTTEDLPIPANMQGKKIRVAFSHTSREGSTPVWQILSANIKDQSLIGE
jgi:hypothetical protein